MTMIDHKNASSAKRRLTISNHNVVLVKIDVDEGGIRVRTGMTDAAAARAIADAILKLRRPNTERERIVAEVGQLRARSASAVEFARQFVNAVEAWGADPEFVHCLGEWTVLESDIPSQAEAPAVREDLN